jgi:hypothetical protein
MNTASDVSHTCFTPNRSPAQPVSGITDANASRYTVGIHWIVAIDVWKSRPSVGNATFTIVASSTVMIAPSTTTAASARISRVKIVSRTCASGGCSSTWVITVPSCFSKLRVTQTLVSR